MKPVASGGRWRLERRGRRWVSEDALALARAARVEDPWSLINPICFEEPLAPWTAALRAHRPIRLEVLLRAFRSLCARHEFVIVEGIGGLLVPLTARATVAELARRMNLPLILVTRPGLGTLNHTLLSLRVAEACGLSVVGVIVNAVRPPSREPFARLAEQTNPEILNRLSRGRLLGSLPFVSGVRGGATNGLPLERYLNVRALTQLVMR
jgi:dethiobiotin synthetase